MPLKNIALKLSTVLILVTLGAFGCANIALAQAAVDTNALILSLQKQILQLLTQIQTIQKEVAELKTETGIQASPIPPISPLSPLAEEEEAEETELPDFTPLEKSFLTGFTRSLSLGARGDDVRKLQEFLARDREIYPEGLTTGYYGPKTAEAVRRWQRKNNVEAVGIVGPKTIAKFRELGRGVVQGLIQEGAGRSGAVPPGLLTAPGIQRQMAITTTPIVMPPIVATTTPSTATTATTTPYLIATTTPAIPAEPATPATPAVPGTTSAVPATPATPTTPAQPATTTPSDTTAPTISNTQASSITSSSAVITWTTNKPSDSVVAFTTKNSCISNGFIITGGGAEWYDCTRSGVGGSDLGNTNTTNHQVILSTLSPSTHYYYQAIFPGDALGVGGAVGQVQTLDTLSATISQPLPDLKVDSTPSITPSSPSTNQPATVGLRITNWSSAATITNFSPTFAVESTPNSGDISAGTYAEAKIQNITRADCPVNLGPYGSCYITFTIAYTTPGQKIFWIRVDPQNQIQEVNENNNSMQSMSFNVIAPSSTDTTPPTVTLAVGYPNLTAQTQPVYVGFSANEEVKVVYEYGLTTSYGSTLNVWDSYWTGNGIYLPTLSSGTTYHIRAKATDRAGNIGYSQDYVFTTVSPNSPPVITSGPNHTPTDATPKEAILVGFATSLDCNSSIQYGLNTSYSSTKSPSDPTNKTSHSFYLTGLAANTTYYYKITCVGTSGTIEQTGNYTTGSTTTTTTPTSTATTTSAVLDSLSGLLQKLKDLLR